MKSDISIKILNKTVRESQKKTDSKQEYYAEVDTGRFQSYMHTN